MATDSTSTQSAVVPETTSETAQQAAAPEEGAPEESAPEEGAPAETAPTEHDAAATEPSGTADTSATARGHGGHVAGAGAIISAALGVSSLTGTPLSEMLRSHEQISGQIKAQSGGNVNQIDALYSMPWHTAALSNGIIAVIAVLIGGGVLAAFLRSQSRSWVKAVALSGVVLGILGVFMSGGMYLDLFASPPKLPTMPMSGGMR